MSDKEERHLHHEFSRYADSPIAAMTAPDRSERFVEQAAPVAHAAKEHIDHLPPQLGRKLAQKYGDSPVAGISRTTGTLYEDASGGQQLRRDWAAVEGGSSGSMPLLKRAGEASPELKQSYVAPRAREADLANEAEQAAEAKRRAAEADFAARQQARIGLANLKAPPKPDQTLAAAAADVTRDQAQQELRRRQEWDAAAARVAPATTDEKQFQEGLKALRAAEERVFDRMQHAREAELSRQEADLGPHPGDAELNRPEQWNRTATAREASSGVDAAYTHARDLLYGAKPQTAERGRLGELYHEAKDAIAERVHLATDSLARNAKDIAQEGRAQVEDVVGDGRHVARDASRRAQETYNTVAARANNALTGAQDAADAGAGKLRSLYSDAKAATTEAAAKAKDLTRDAAATAADKIDDAAAEARWSLHRTATTAADKVDAAADAAHDAARNAEERARATVANLKDKAADAARDVKDLYREVKAQAASGLKDVGAARDVRIAAGDAADAAKSSLRDAKNAFADRVDRAADAARDATADVKATYRDAKNALTDRIDRSADATRAVADDASVKAAAAYRDARAAATEGAAAAAEAARGTTVEAGAKAKELYRDANETLKEGAAKVGDALESAGEKVHDLLVDATTAVRDATAARVEDLRRENVPLTADEAAAAEASAKAVYRDAKETVKEGLRTVGDAIEAAADKVASVAKDAINDARDVAAQTWPDVVKTTTERRVDETVAPTATTAPRAATTAAPNVVRSDAARADHDRHWWEGGVGDSVSGAAGVIHPTHRHQGTTNTIGSERARLGGFEDRSYNDQRYALAASAPPHASHSLFSSLDERPLYLNAVREPWALMRRALGPWGSMYSPIAVHHALDAMDREIARTQSSIKLSHWTIGAGTALGLGSAYLLWAASPLLRGSPYVTRPEAGTRAARRAIGAAHPRIPYPMTRFAASPLGVIAGLVGLLMAGMTLPMEYMQLQANRRSLRHVQATRDDLAVYSATQDERELH